MTQSFRVMQESRLADEISTALEQGDGEYEIGDHDGAPITAIVSSGAVRLRPRDPRAQVEIKLIGFGDDSKTRAGGLPKDGCFICYCEGGQCRCVPVKCDGPPIMI